MDSVFLIWLFHVLAVQSLTLAELVVSVCTSYCLQMELGTHLFRGLALVRVLAALRKSNKLPSEQSIWVRLPQMMPYEDGVMCVFCKLEQGSARRCEKLLVMSCELKGQR